MKTNSLFRVISGLGNIVQKAGDNTAAVCTNLLEDKLIRGHYVTRGEYEALRELVLKLQKEVADLRSHIK